MKNLVKVVLFLFVCFAGVSNAYAFSFLQNWQLDADGTGKVTVDEIIDTTGTTNATNTYITPTTFSFTETATFFSYSYLAPGPAPPAGTTVWPFDGVLSGVFTGGGVGDVSSGLTFTPGGSLSIDFDPTGAAAPYNLGTFSLLSGYAVLDGSAVPNGIITTIFESVSLRTATWFDESGTDLSTLSPISLTLGFATTNASLIRGDEGPFEPGDVQELLISNNGQFRLAVVPEPSTFLLLGAGLVGLGFLSRRRKS